ncbi:hypothetical protein CCACVL1_30126 [Corchorus capsularis]|uniref:Uncharacterized protein n=1 Tax=Corchorus capsularis TaxID=210143 RepID=A0A1R3FYQ0_COCAP|nr:hypothetical protein CCACVL1_30126 [Corchorus capsularis]
MAFGASTWEREAPHFTLPAFEGCQQDGVCVGSVFPIPDPNFTTPSPSPSPPPSPAGMTSQPQHVPTPVPGGE